MDLQELIDNSGTIQAVIGGKGWRVEETIDELVASEQWGLAGRLLVSAAEISARKLVDALLEAEAYETLGEAGCLRRQPHQVTTPGAGGSRLADRVFSDIDAEENAAGVPDFIRSDIEDMTKSAAERREAAALQEEAVDRDPVRNYIVQRMAPHMKSSEEAMNAMVAIARASAWEGTRRDAALKIANDEICVRRLCEQLRTDDIVEIAQQATLATVRETFAGEMGKHFEALRDEADATALRFIAENHPSEQYRDSAAQWADAIEAEQGRSEAAEEDG